MNYTTIEELYNCYLQHPVISKDTRNIEKGCVYFALKGESFDGNEFAADALKKGAAYVVIDNPEKKRNEHYLLVEDSLKALQQLANYHRENLSIPIIAVTGSNGKTTTKELIASVLAKKYNTLSTTGNYNNHIGVPLTLLRIRPEHQIAIIEMGANHQGEINFLCDIANPDFGLITNIGKAHLEGFGGIEGVKKGKSELYRSIKQKDGIVFINADDEVLLDLNPCEAITYGTQKEFYCYGELSHTHPTVQGKWECGDASGQIDSCLYGEYNFYNMLAAICIGNYYEISAKDISVAINEYESDMNRSQLIEKEGYRVYLDAYNANPTSMSLAISNFEKSVNAQKVVILGDMFELGDEAKVEHGKIVEQLLASTQLQACILVGENFYQHRIEHNRLKFFKKTEEVSDWFSSADKLGKAFLLKGSRGMRIESILK